MLHLLTRHAAAFLQPEEVLDLPWVQQLCTEEPIWHLTLQGALVGVIWWQALLPGQSATCHMVLNPLCVRQFWRQKMGITLLHTARQRWGLTHLYAQFEPGRTQPPKWLKRLGFKPYGTNGEGQVIWQCTFSD